MKTIAECLAANIRTRRKQLQLTQADLAERTELSTITIQQLETCNIWFGKTTIEAIAKGLNISETALFQDPENRSPTTPEEALNTIERTLREQQTRIREIEAKLAERRQHSETVQKAIKILTELGDDKAEKLALAGLKTVASANRKKRPIDKKESA